MSLSVVKRPEGLVINITPAVSASYTFNSSTATRASHGRSTGDYIYISTGQFIGFWYVTVLGVNTFNISEYATAPIKTFIGAGTFLYSTTQKPTSNAYNAVHLPIVYKLQSTLWPTNSVDTVRTVSSYSNDNGYVKLTLSGDLTSTVTELEFVKVIYGGTSYIYQILTWYSNSIVTINLAYLGGYGFTSVQYYYNNYHAKIRIYAGLSSTHTFGSIKPYRLITEQREVPDSSGVITLNVADFLKEQIEILKNDLGLGTLPNNIDAYCQFYITYAEAYDYSIGGYTLLDFVSSYTDDSGTLEGIAVNADLPFKNIYSGMMGEYIFVFSPNFKFLTPSLYPVHFGNYFDISWINNSTLVKFLRKEYYINNVLQSTVDDVIESYNIGVYRRQILLVGTEDRIDVSLWTSSGPTQLSEKKTITVDATCTKNYLDFSWLNYLGGFDHWRFKSNADYSQDIEATIVMNKNIFTSWPNSFGAGADTIRKETSRQSRSFITVRAEFLTQDQVNDLMRIRLSPLVQIVTSTYDKLTVTVDTQSFTYLKQSDKLFNLSFQVSLTNQNPSQKL